MSIYTDMIKAGVPVDNHESDLYVLGTGEARRILEEHGQPLRPFTSQIDGKVWYDIPLSFDPFWERKRFQNLLADGVKQITLDEEQS